MSICRKPLPWKNICSTAMVQIMRLLTQSYLRQTLITLIFFWMDHSAKPMLVN